jgi:GH35 family endo-1,4-beta-xylanase/peptidoglycan/xylan/chitin deacetylase (PgdA/CDA1 family)
MSPPAAHLVHHAPPMPARHEYLPFLATLGLMVTSVPCSGCSDPGDGEALPLQSIDVIVDPAETPFLLDGALGEGQVALTFDDGPADPETTRAILRTLEKYGVKAVFFQVGIHAESHPEITREILLQGHALGSHSWDHANLTELPLEEAIDNIERGHRAVMQAADTGTSMPFFRFPFLESSEELRQAVQGMGLAAFHANIISEDHSTPDPDELLAKALAAVEAEQRGIILFHDIQPQTADMLDAFLHELEVRGYRTVVFRPRPTLASLAVRHDIRVGASFFWPDEYPDARYRETALREFNMFTIPAYLHEVQRERGQFDFSLPDQTADIVPPGARIRVHNLIWCDNLPEWIEQGEFTGAELEQILTEHVTTVVQHYESKYPGKVAAWDVVNEPLSWQGDTCPWNRIGLEAGRDQHEYIRIALKTARSLAPGATLYINDFGIEGMNEKSDRMFELVSRLLQEGIPLDGVGLESHFVIGSDELFGRMPPVDDVIDNMNRLGALGLEISITEADFSIRNEQVSPATLARQAEEYGKLMYACLAATGCKAFMTWGVGDQDSWINDFAPGWGAPLLFDSEYRPKPAYHAIAEELATF